MSGTGAGDGTAQADRRPDRFSDRGGVRDRAAPAVRRQDAPGVKDPVVVDLLSVPGCPNVDLTRRRLAKATVIVGLDVQVRAQEVTTPDEAAAVGMRGSPSVLVDGRDVGDAEDEPSMSCRLYRSASGALEGAPSVETLVDAFRP
ncbi:MAG: hypothetical protein M3Q48_00760 [Actinomycetota bacterium]|nr:hypothetical protein [Actinomycetota bacterium]